VILENHRDAILLFIDSVKKYLIEEYDYNTFEDFVDNKELGDCQEIVSAICYRFKDAKKVFGEIELSDYYVDENGDEQNIMTHHWILYKNTILDFSKGSLKEYIDDDIYNPEIYDSGIYHPISGNI
jgi:hypothetical protein